MKAKITFDWLTKLILRFTLLRLQKYIHRKFFRYFSQNFIGNFLKSDERNRAIKENMIFHKLLRISNIVDKLEFLFQIKAIQHRQKLGARRSIVDEHGMPPEYTQSK